MTSSVSRAIASSPVTPTRNLPPCVGRSAAALARKLLRRRARSRARAGLCVAIITGKIAAVRLLLTKRSPRNVALCARQYGSPHTCSSLVFKAYPSNVRRSVASTYQMKPKRKGKKKKKSDADVKKHLGEAVMANIVKESVLEHRAGRSAISRADKKKHWRATRKLGKCFGKKTVVFFRCPILSRCSRHIEWFRCFECAKRCGDGEEQTGGRTLVSVSTNGAFREQSESTNKVIQITTLLRRIKATNLRGQWTWQAPITDALSSVSF